MYPNRHLHVDDNQMLGYKWSAQSQYGIIIIDEAELFMRVEFENLPSQEHEWKVSYAMNMGWRYNVDTGKWYRLRGH